MVKDLQEGNRLVGFYKGQVLKHRPQGKCKLWIPSVYPEKWRTQPDMLPDAEQASPIFCGNFAGNGTFSWPNIGSIVWCFFANNDQNYPVYFAATNGGLDANDQFQTTVSADVDLTNTELELSRVHRLNAGKSSFTMYEDGTISARTVFPSETPTASDGSNCTYSEFLVQKYMDQAWQLTDVYAVENKNHRKIAVGICVPGSTSDFQSAFQADADAKPPKIDVFYYGVGSGSGGMDSDEDEDFKKVLSKTGNKYKSVSDDVKSIANRQRIFMFADGDDSNVDDQLEYAAKNKYSLFVCRAENFKDVKDKGSAQSKASEIASKYGMNVLIISPKHCNSNFAMNDLGYMSSFTMNDFRSISSSQNVDVDGKISSWTIHVMSADQLSIEQWPQLGVSYSRSSVDSAGNSYLDGVYTNLTSETSCILDMTTDQHIRHELRFVKMDSSHSPLNTTYCTTNSDTKDGTTDISVMYHDFSSGKKTYSTIRMTKDGETFVKTTKSLDIFIQDEQDTQNKSHMNMTAKGNIQIDSTKSIKVNAPTIDISGDDVSMSGKTTNIKGNNGDCNINRVSLVKHTHKYKDSNTKKPNQQ